MKSYRKELWFEVPTRRAFINITPEVEECLRQSGIKEGLVLCNAMIAACMLCMGTLASEVWHVFVIGFLQAAFEAAGGFEAAYAAASIEDIALGYRLHAGHG